MKKTEWHKQVTVRIDDFATITLSDEMGGLGTFIDEKLSRAKNIFETHELLINFLQANLTYHKQRKSSICHEGETLEEYTEGLRRSAKRHDLYIEGEI